MISVSDCSHPVDIADEPQHHLVIANEYVRAFAVEVAPRSSTLCHRHPHDYVLYVAAGAEIISAARDEAPKTLNYVTGECELSKAGLVHVVENLGDAAFRNIVVELHPRAQDLRRGIEPILLGGEAAIERILNNELCEVVAIDLLPRGEIEISGPAVLAAPSAPVMVRELDQYDIPLDDFRKLMWVCAPRKVGIRNATEKPAKVVAVRMGRVMQPYINE